jgi:hypothetical protein
VRTPQQQQCEIRSDPPATSPQAARAPLLGTIAALLIGIAARAEPACPSLPRHPNMDKAAKDLCAAEAAITAAATANKHELGGHAEKALAALRKALEELREAAAFANQPKGPGSGSHGKGSAAHN